MAEDMQPKGKVFKPHVQLAGHICALAALHAHSHIHTHIQTHTHTNTHTHTHKMLDEFTDVNRGEKELMKLWNLFAMENRLSYLILPVVQNGG